MLKNVWTRKLDIQKTFPNPFWFIHFKSEPTPEPVPTSAIRGSKGPQVLEEERQKKIRNAEIEINRILEDTNLWLQDIKEQDKKDIDQINQNIQYFMGGKRITENINRVNNLIKKINNYKREMNRKIEDILIAIEEENFASVDWLEVEYQNYLKFVRICENAKREAKQKNDEKFSDEPTLNIIKGQNPYIE